MSVKPFFVPLLAVAVAAAGCSFGNGGLGRPQDAIPAAAMPATGNPVGQYIKHVVVIIQENRSFENFFAGYPGADAPMSGLAGGRRVRLHEITFDGPDLPHDWHSSMVDWDNGKMDGFYKFGNHSKQGRNPAYAYVQRSLIFPYWSLAKQYVLADHMFPTEFGGSFTAHLTLVAGTDNLTPTTAEVDFPDGAPDDCDSPPGTTSSTVNDRRKVGYFTGPFPCFSQFNTMAKTLDNAGVSWRFYATRLLDAGTWEPFEAIKYVRYGADWKKNIIAPQTRFLTELSRRRPLAKVTWITPSKVDSDHPGRRNGPDGPLWVSSLVDTIGESPDWNSTAIIILWDDWGGWYDNLPPPQLDFRGLGIRVPCIIVSPYARQGYVSHTQYEFGSILKFIEEAFNLPALGPTSAGYTDTRANSLDDSFDFTQAPRPFTRLVLPAGTLSHFLTEPPSDEPVDTE
jgi:phospholipase C